MQNGVVGHNSIKLLVVVLAVASSAVATLAQVGEVGRFDGVKDIQNLYDVVYNYDSFGEHLHNNNWHTINFATVNMPYGPVPFSLSVDINLYALVPAAIWISPYTILGAEYGGYIAPVFASHSFAANLFSEVDGSARGSGLGLGDFNAHALWLDWAKEHWDFSLAYGFHAPAGYDGRTAALPDGVEAPMEATDKFGLGYSAQHARAGVAWYPMTNKATAVTFAWTYEYNRGMEYFDVRPGQMFTVSWEVSQCVPLRKDRELLLEVGPAGYDTCQITDSTGGNALADAPKSHIHALGGELGLTYVPWNAFLTFRSFYEYAADSRFQGAAVGMNFGIKF